MMQSLIIVFSDCKMREPSQLAVDIRPAEVHWRWNECERLINETIK